MTSTAPLPRYDHYIGGRAMAPVSGRYLPTEDPYTGVTWAEVARGDAADILSLIHI